MGAQKKNFEAMTNAALIAYLFDVWISWRFDDISDYEATQKWELPYSVLAERGLKDAWPYGLPPDA